MFSPLFQRLLVALVSEVGAQGLILSLGLSEGGSAERGSVETPGSRKILCV